jgi:hypothetical protein
MRAEATSTRTFGTDAEGFAVGMSEDASSVQVRVWGFWSSDLAARFVGAVTSACSSFAVPRMILDATELKPQRDAGQEALAALMATLSALRITRVVVMTASPLTRLQLMRIVKERGIKHLVPFVP